MSHAFDVKVGPKRVTTRTAWMTPLSYILNWNTVPFVNCYNLNHAAKAAAAVDKAAQLRKRAIRAEHIDCAWSFLFGWWPQGTRSHEASSRGWRERRRKRKVRHSCSQSGCDRLCWLCASKKRKRGRASARLDRMETRRLARSSDCRNRHQGWGYEALRPLRRLQQALG